jgi:hypothetical protein
MNKFRWKLSTHKAELRKPSNKCAWQKEMDIWFIDIHFFCTTVHARFPLVFSGVRVTRSLVLCICCVYRCLSFCTVSFCHCVVCSSIYGLWLPLWCLQTLIMQCLTWFKEIQQFILIFPQLLNVWCETLIYVREVRMEL